MSAIPLKLLTLLCAAKLNPFFLFSSGNSKLSVGLGAAPKFVSLMVFGEKPGDLYASVNDSLLIVAD